MPTKYINQKRTNGGFLRPRGYAFPVGLSARITSNNVIDYLVVAGGGGSTVQNQYSGGGGGAGGFLTGSNASIPVNSSFTITVGAGGASKSGTTSEGANGNDTYISYNSTNIYLAKGGGYGAKDGITGGAGGSSGGNCGYGTTSIKPGNKVYQLYGYSADIYELIKRVEIDPKALIKAIEAIEI